jgi:putative ABC transport system permease protein
VRAAHRRSVPLARRQLLREPLKLVLALLGVAVSVALVGLLFGLREGIGRQVSTYPDNAGADLYVASGGTRNFLSASSSSLPVSLGRRLRRVAGVEEVAPITAWFDIVPLHGMKIVTEHVGFEPRRLGGPWSMLEGRAPSGEREVAVDRVMAGQHELDLGDSLELAGRSLRVVGLTDETASWMAPPPCAGARAPAPSSSYGRGTSRRRSCAAASLARSRSSPSSPASRSPPTTVP